MELLRLRKWSESATALRAQKAQASGDLDLVLGLSEALVYEGKVGEALRELFASLGAVRGDSRNLVIQRIGIVSRVFLKNQTFQTFSEGWDHLLAGRWAQAREKLEQARQAEPENCEILTRLGQALLLNNEPDAAAERLREVRALNPLLAAPRLWLGRALHQRGETLPALNEFKEVLPLLEGSEDALIWYSEALISAHMKAEAVVLLEDSVKRRPFMLRTYLELARLRLRDLDKAQPGARIWSARKDLQIIQSRMASYGPESSPEPLIELGLPTIWNKDRLQKEVSLAMVYVDQQLESLNLASPTEPATKRK